MNRQLEPVDDYLSGAMTGAEAEAFEAAMFDGAAAGEAEGLTFVEELRRSLVDLAHRGSFEITLTRAEVDALLRDSPLRVLVYDARRDNRLDATRALAGFDLVVFEFSVALAGTGRIDLELGLEGATRLVLPDVKVDREQDHVYLCCEGDLARAAFRPGLCTRVVSVDGDVRRQLAEFVYAPELP